MDKISKEQRSRNMAAIRSKGNKTTEAELASLLRKNRIVGWRRHTKKLLGSPDFLFPQMSDPSFAPKDWHPQFFDYLYMSFTNASAFSPTDVLPLTRWAKMLMLLQSTTSLIVVGLVVAKAVNILH